MLTIGVIGCGYWGLNYLRIFNELAHVRVPRICDSDEKQISIVRQHYPDVQVHLNSQALLQDTTLDAVVVATPAITHYMPLFDNVY